MRIPQHSTFLQKISVSPRRSPLENKGNGIWRQKCPRMKISQTGGFPATLSLFKLWKEMLSESLPGEWGFEVSSFVLNFQ